MRLCNCLAISVLLLVTPAWGQVVRLREFEDAKDGMPGEQRYSRTIEIDPNLKIDVVIDVTVRRNGVLRAANLKLKVLDEYDDGQFYQGGLLHVEFVDITGDGFQDLVITGTVVHTGDKETDPRTYETVTSVYVFDPKSKEFHKAFHLGPKLELG